MKKARRKVSEFSSSELIRIARQAISSGMTESDNFKSVFGVDFSFKQLCLSLHKRRYNGVRIMSAFEYEKIAELSKKQLEELFYSILTRYEEILIKNHEDRED